MTWTTLEPLHSIALPAFLVSPLTPAPSFEARTSVVANLSGAEACSTPEHTVLERAILPKR